MENANELTPGQTYTYWPLVGNAMVITIARVQDLGDGWAELFGKTSNGTPLSLFLFEGMPL